LLAVGDPVFARPGQAAALPALPGTRREVEAVAPLFARAEVLLGPDASQQRLDALARDGRLRAFSVLHLATHAELHPGRALQSALVLSQDALPDPLEQARAGKKVYDGRLTAEEILRDWQLDADLVTLSACQTGLGRESGGEGYLGFSQVLFLAGARSLLLSLWPVDDQATALLMQRFYQTLLGQRAGSASDRSSPLPKAEALREAKAWLRGLSAQELDQAVTRLPRERGGERPKPSAAPGSDKPYGHPYYWSAFILIGDPD
jgi:CHAT domain-containing protein